MRRFFASVALIVLATIAAAPAASATLQLRTHVADGGGTVPFAPASHFLADGGGTQPFH